MGRRLRGRDGTWFGTRDGNTAINIIKYILMYEYLLLIAVLPGSRSHTPKNNRSSCPPSDTDTVQHLQEAHVPVAMVAACIKRERVGVCEYHQTALPNSLTGSPSATNTHEVVPCSRKSTEQRHSRTPGYMQSQYPAASSPAHYKKYRNFTVKGAHLQIAHAQKQNICTAAK